MPTTINGIGTHYYGQRNLERYRGTCDSCGREVELHNYETTLWFVVIFVPVIPLGKKQIFGDCTSCRRHRVLSAEQWKQIQEDSLRQQVAAASQDLNSAGAQIELLNMLAAFNRHDEAERLATDLQQRFPNDPAVRLRLGAWYETTGRTTVADQHFRRALELDPTNLAAKHAVAVGMIQEGNLDGAQRLLAAAPALTVKQDPAVYVALAEALQKRNQHEQALPFYRQVLAEVPAAAQDPKLRKQIALSEKEVPHAGSMLPSIPLTQRRGFWPAVIVLLLLGGFGFAEYYIANHRTLYIVNGIEEPVEVQLENGGGTTVQPGGIARLPITEGTNRATLSSPARGHRGFEFAVESNLFARLFRSPAYVLNIDGGAVVAWEQTTYTAAHNPADDKDQKIEFHIGRPFVAIDDADYFFTEFPPSLQSKGSRQLKSRVTVHVHEPALVVVASPESVGWDDRLAFAETHLRGKPSDLALLSVYSQVCSMQNQTDRCRKFLEEGLERAPIVINWHRAYQTFRENLGEEQTLLDEYQARLDKDPGNSAWLYLRGRIEPDSKAALALYDKAIAADANNPYPWLAKGYREMSAGDFTAGRKSCEQAFARIPDDPQVQNMLYLCRLATGDLPRLETDMRNKLNVKPGQWNVLSDVLEVMALQNKRGLLQPEVDQFLGRLSVDDRASAPGEYKLYVPYLTGDFDRVRQEAANLSSLQDRAAWNFYAALAMGNLDEAEAHFVNAASTPRPYLELLLSVARRRQGNAAKADDWQKKATANWAEAGGADDKKLVALFKRIPQVTVSEVNDIDASEPYEKAILMTALAQLCPDQKTSFLDAAEKFNFRPWTPNPYLKTILQQLRAK